MGRACVRILLGRTAFFSALYNTRKGLRKPFRCFVNEVQGFPLAVDDLLSQERQIDPHRRAWAPCKSIMKVVQDCLYIAGGLESQERRGGLQVQAWRLHINAWSRWFKAFSMCRWIEKRGEGRRSPHRRLSLEFNVNAFSRWLNDVFLLKARGNQYTCTYKFESHIWMYSRGSSRLCSYYRWASGPRELSVLHQRSLRSSWNHMLKVFQDFLHAAYCFQSQGIADLCAYNSEQSL